MRAISLQGNAGGTGTLTVAAPSTNTNRTLTLPDGTGTFTMNGVNSNIVAGTAVASTSGVLIDFTGIPSWVKRITVMFNGVSTTGTSNPILRIGNSAIVATGYASNVMQVINGAVTAGSSGTSNTAFSLWNSGWSAAYDLVGSVTLTLLSNNIWVCSGTLGSAQTAQGVLVNGTLALSSALDRIRLTTNAGTDTFDAGSINILYE